MRPVIIYDDTCGFCTTQVRRLARLAGAETLGSSSPEAAALVDETVREQFPRQLVALLDGRPCGGAEAIARLLSRRWWLAGLRLYYLPGLRQVADAAYRLVAARRHRLGACVRPTGQE